MLNVVLLATVAACLAAGQLLFKQAGLAIRGRPVAEGLLMLMTMPGFFAALAIYGCATLLWVWVLSRVPLIEAYPWVALTTVIVPLLGWFVFGERVTPLFWIGLVLILLGLMVTQLGLERPI